MEKMKVRIEIWFWLAIIGKGNKHNTVIRYVSSLSVRGWL